MGTVYHVTAYCEETVVDLDARIRGVLDSVNAEMSTYDANSTLSRFNASPVGEWFPVSRAMIDVLSVAQSLSAMSQGAFDVTVAPLVNLYGFGPVPAPETEPSAAEVDAARAMIGYDYLEVRRDPPALRKRRPLEVDLSAVAKGYGVDAVAATVVDAGCPDVMVEIGGEVFAAGGKPDGTAWRIGIEVPDSVPGTAIGRVVRLRGQGVATSGDYRNYIEWSGRRYSHTFDGRTGAPVDHGLASVTVIRPTTLEADGFATLLEVLGPDAGWDLAEASRVAALFIERTDTGFATRVTTAMQSHLEPSTP